MLEFRQKIYLIVATDVNKNRTLHCSFQRPTQYFQSFLFFRELDLFGCCCFSHSVATSHQAKNMNPPNRLQTIINVSITLYTIISLFLQFTCKCQLFLFSQKTSCHKVRLTSTLFVKSTMSSLLSQVECFASHLVSSLGKA